jgi:hypothetical protein
MAKIERRFVGPGGGTFKVSEASGVTQLMLDEVAITATPAEINAVAGAMSARHVNVGASLSATKALHDGKTLLLNALTGSDLTLPLATGSGAKIHVVVSVRPTSNEHTILCAGTNEFAGVIYQVDTDTSDAIAAYPAIAADDYDTITLNGTTTGGLIGDRFVLEDIITGTWALQGWSNANGAVATPLSSA